MVFTNLSGINYTPTPITNISPLTYRDGATFLEYLETIKQYINDTLVPDSDAMIANAITSVNDVMADWDAKYTEIMNNLAAQIALLNESAVTGMVGTGTVHDAIIALIDAAITAERATTAATYLSKTDAGTTYLNKTDAGTTYLNKTDAGTTYLSKTDAGTTYGTKTRVEQIAKAANTDPVDVVFIGDSYFTGYQDLPNPYLTSVPQRVTALLNREDTREYVMHNYAGNAGGYNTTYGTPDTAFNTQADTAIADTSITNCRLIIVGGGRNDYNFDNSASATSIYNKLLAKWPNAKLVVFPMWSRERFGAAQRRGFTTIFEAAKNVGAVYDVNSLWVNSLTDASLWDGTSVLHPKDQLAQRFASALYTLIQGGSLPAQTTNITVHSSTGITTGVATINGYSVNLSFQQDVGANFDTSYPLASLQYPALWPGEVNQYIQGFSGNGTTNTLYTVGQADGTIVGTGTAGRVGMTGTYPLGM